MEDLIKKVEGRIVNFAMEHDKIEAVCFGEFGGVKEVYTFLTNKKNYDSIIEDQITDLDLDIMRQFNYNVRLIVLPFGKKVMSDFERTLYEKA